MNEPKISVIIPVYKVEPYLRKCLDSVIGQTHQNLEIILIDDGSPDNCGTICDEFAAEDIRIRVIHQENGGVSAARNAGLRVASGDYIGFVDSDDWIEPDMFACMLRGLLNADADISVCGRYEEYKNRSVCRGWDEKQTLDTEQAMLLLLENGQMQNLLWDKLFCRALFDNIWFPEGKTYEDLAIMYQLFLRAKTVVCVPEIMYHYRQRPGSIVNDTSLKNRINHYTSAKDRYEDLRGAYPQFEKQAAAQCVASAIGIWCAYYSDPKAERKVYSPILREIAAFSKEHHRSASECISLGITGRAVVRLVPYKSAWAFALAGFWGRVYKLKHGRLL